MKSFLGLLAVVWALPASSTIVHGSVTDDDEGHHHHHGHHHKHHKHNNATAPAVAVKPPPVVKAAVQESSMIARMRKLEAELAEKAKKQAEVVANGHILVNGPIPADFNERFAQAVGHSTGTDAAKVKVTGTSTLDDSPGIVEVAFTAPRKVVKDVENDAADPESKLSKGNLRPFLIAQTKEDSMAAASYHAKEAQIARDAALNAKLAAAKAKASEADHHEHIEANQLLKDHKEPEPLHIEQHDVPKSLEVAEEEEPHDHHLEHQEATPIEEKGIDIDTQMPYGDLEPFGREDTAQELTESSVKESDAMVDQLERAEVAEEKRSVFRALTRLRGAAITSFDGVARSQTGNIDEYNKIHKWRKAHPLHHLADEESDVTKWAFPDNADFLQTAFKAH